MRKTYTIAIMLLAVIAVAFYTSYISNPLFPQSHITLTVSPEVITHATTTTPLNLTFTVVSNKPLPSDAFIESFVQSSAPTTTSVVQSYSPTVSTSTAELTGSTLDTTIVNGVVTIHPQAKSAPAIEPTATSKTNTLPYIRISLTQVGDSSTGTTTYTAHLTVPSHILATPQTFSFRVRTDTKPVTSAEQNIQESTNDQRIVHVAITDIPVTLPPNPGEAGKATLAGIDSDNDDVRDDVQREIVFLYPNDNVVRRVLRAMAKKEQQIITTTGGHSYFARLMLNYLSLEVCYDYLVTGMVSDLRDINILQDMLSNTPERLKNSTENYHKSLPFAGPVGYTDQRNCTSLEDQY